jgi:hypothetical protein
MASKRGNFWAGLLSLRLVLTRQNIKRKRAVNPLLGHSLVEGGGNESGGLDGWMLNPHSAIIPTRFPACSRRSQLNEVKLASSKGLEISEKSTKEKVRLKGTVEGIKGCQKAGWS